MKIVGIDPSLVNTGLVSLEGNPGAWSVSNLSLVTTKSANKTPAQIKAQKKAKKTPTQPVRKNYDDLDRARELLEKILAFVEDADFICVEIPQIGGADMQARSMWTSGVALGLIASLSPEKVIALTPVEVKNATGNKKASKEEMCDWAYALYPNAPWPARKLKGNMVRLITNHHIADALASIAAGLEKKNLWLSQSVVSAS